MMEKKEKIFIGFGLDNTRYPKPTKRLKYGNIKTLVDGIKFDSKKEAKRYGELKLLEKAGEISVLRLQVTFNLSVCKYKADFVYYDKTNHLIVEDCKGMKTPVYNLKKKMMKHELGIDILET